MRFTQLIVGQSVGTPSLYDRYYYTDIDNRYILMQSGVSHLVSTPQTPPPPIGSECCLWWNSLHTLASIIYKSLMGTINVILTCLTCDIDGHIVKAKQSRVSAALCACSSLQKQQKTVTAGDLVVEFSNLMFPLNPFGSPWAKWRGGGNLISSLAAWADG